MKYSKVCLYGTCGKSRYREYVIPLLEKKGISYFNPVVPIWNEEARLLENRERADENNLILYVITPYMKGVYSIAEIVDDSHRHPDRIIVCFLRKEWDNCFTEPQWQSILGVAEILKRNCVDVFYSLQDVLNHFDGIFDK